MRKLFGHLLPLSDDEIEAICKDASLRVDEPGRLRSNDVRVVKHRMPSRGTESPYP